MQIHKKGERECSLCLRTRVHDEMVLGPTMVLLHSLTTCAVVVCKNTKARKNMKGWIYVGQHEPG